MPEPQYVVAIIILGLGAIAWFMVVNWKNSWDTRLTAQDSRLDRHADKHSEHDTNHATLTERLDHIKDTADETRQDVKELLRHSNGNRSTG